VAAQGNKKAALEFYKAAKKDFRETKNEYAVNQCEKAIVQLQ
jgi:hypothetical protein